ncbi:carboxylesterase/lipase family protein [Robiginitalea sp. SC105]|uniref:carboxylesterase/lipase family protein n=1 Tax=Robiginitalea sp. SC105 TaxID=2762332 RepID=UPI00163B27AA|nr:carboxylesterase family protein [Robiginitalea sp. SC105]MBC2840281.1 carboxylesterase family protein [Robiginitalea sp. SC105]
MTIATGSTMRFITSKTGFHLLQRALGSLLLVGMVLVHNRCQKGNPDIPLAQTSSGMVSGVKTGEGLQVFRGIPFAAPPVGDLRWKPPQPAPSWEGIRKCAEFGPSPVQGPPRPFMYWSEEFLIPETPISEDCLYLNVWTPEMEPEVPKPVLVYIYGGGFRSGGSACPIYDGSAVAGKDVVFVSINYRVGVFGFLAHPELTAESKRASSGNYALLDMVAGLEWVRDNIRAFGGDPGQVTIAGQSAGAFAVNYLTVMPEARGLFHRAIAQSGSSFQSTGLGSGIDLATAESQGRELEAEMGVTGIEGLRDLPAEKLLNARNGSQGPIIDGEVVPNPVTVTYENGEQARVPLLLGWNKDDLVWLPSMSPDEFHSGFPERFGPMEADFKAAYPAGDSLQARESQRRLSRDQTFGYPVFTWAKNHSRTSGEPVYLYNFNRDLPAYDKATQFGAFHSGEIVYAYDNLHTLDRPWEIADRQLASAMSAYWVNFAKTGDPNGPGLVPWEPFTEGAPQVQLLDTAIRQVPLPDLETYGLWDSLGRAGTR